MKMSLFRITMLFAMTAFLASPMFGDDSQRQGDWLMVTDTATGTSTLKMGIELTPKAECKPALRYRLIADGHDLIDENSAVYYLKALGFLEQQYALELLLKERAQARKIAEETGTPIGEVAPFVWQDAAPSELPIEKVKEHLSRTSFQTRELAEAAKRKHFSMERNIRSVDNPVMYLLPEIQTMRELARNQRLRCRLAIAEGRVDDAFAILGQQFALSRHLDQDQFLVSALVGSAISGIAWEDSLHLLQHTDCPNLYWAFASLPNPFNKMENAMDYERQFFFEQVKVMQEVDEKLRPAGYWQEFIEKFAFQVRDLGLSPQSGMDQSTIVAMIAASYPAAKQYLIEEQGMDSAKVDAYPTAQVVFLAMRRSYEYLRDENFKWRFVPYSVAIQSADYQKLEKNLREMSARLGWANEIADLLFPAIQQVLQVPQRTQGKISMLQTIESIRDYAASNQGKLPSSLANLRLPAPIDPSTGKTIQYELQDGFAVLTSDMHGNTKWELTLRIRN